MMRREVRWFAERMEAELCANDYKGGWEDMLLADLLTRLREEVEELAEAVKMRAATAHVISEAADVANFAMMIADVNGGLCGDCAEEIA